MEERLAIEVRVLRRGEGTMLGRVAPGVFDREPVPGLTAEFLADPRHHLAVALDGGIVVGFASAVHYVHLDKTPELWINEVGVAPAHRHRGLAKRLLTALAESGHAQGCREAWVLADRSNSAAPGLYASLGSARPPREQVMFAFDLR